MHQEAIALLKIDLEKETKEKQTLAFSSLMKIYSNLGEKTKLTELWKNRNSYSLLPNEVFFKTALSYYFQIDNRDLLKKIAVIAQKYVPDSRHINDVNFVLSSNCKDSLKVLTTYFKYYSTLVPSEEKRFRSSLIGTILRVKETSPELLFLWAKENAKSIPEKIRFDIYNFVDLWKYFPMFEYAKLEITKSNLKLFLGSLISCGRSEYCETVIVNMLKDPKMVEHIPLLYEIRGDIYFYKKEYSKALKYYDEGLTFTQNMVNREIFENLIIKAHCSLFEILKASSADQISERADRVYLPYIPAFQVKLSPQGILLLNTFGGPFTNEINEYVLGFTTMINAAINDNVKDMEIGYILSFTINKDSMIPFIILENLINNLKSIDLLVSKKFPYYSGMQELVSIFENQYFEKDYNLFVSIEPKSKKAYPPDNAFNFWDQSERESFALGAVAGRLDEKFYSTIFRERFFLGVIEGSDFFLFGTQQGKEMEKLQVVKEALYKEFLIKKDVYFKRMSVDETKSIFEILLLKSDANRTLLFNELKEKLIEFSNKYPQYTTIYYWLAQVEAAYGNYSKSNEYIKKVKFDDPTWKEADALKEFLLLSKI